jgi:hypothetical protein
MKIILNELIVLFLLTSCGSFNPKVLDDPKFASGREFETGKKIIPEVFHFNNYTFVTGYSNDSGNSSLALYFRDKEIYYEKTTDGSYGSVMAANLNNDYVQDFLIEYCYEDGCDLFALISKSRNTFFKKELNVETTGMNCDLGGDSLQYLQDLIIKDVNNDGKDEIIVNLLKINNKVVATPCTDTVFVDH